MLARKLRSHRIKAPADSEGTSSEGKLLAVSHTYHQPEVSAPAQVRIISAREATRRERQQYEDEPR